MWVNQRLICSLIVLFMSFTSITLPVSAEIKVDPLVNSSLVPNVGINPAIKDLIIFQNSSDVQLKWKAPILAAIFSGAPAVGKDNTIYVGFTFVWILNVQYGVSAFNSDGAKLWTFLLNKAILTPPTVGPEGTIYTSTGTKGSSGEFVAIRTDGTKKWAFAAGDHIESSPVFGSDGTIYVVSKDGILHALNPKDGSEIWSLDMGVKSQAFLAIGPDDTVYAANGTQLLTAIKPNGTKKWEFSTGGAVSAIPAIGPDGTIYEGSADHKLYAILPSGAKKWEFNQGSSVFAPSVGPDGSVYFGSEDAKLNAVLPDGKLKWQFASGGSSNPPVIGPNGMIYTQSVSNKAIYALDPDGHIRWQYKIETEAPLPLAVRTDGTLIDVSTNYPKVKDVNYDDLEHTLVMYIYALKVPVSSVTLNQTSLNLTEGQSGSLTATITPSHASNAKVTWKSSNPNIASVDSMGKVSALISGTVTITASSGDGPFAQCKITVTERTDQTIDVSGVVLNKTALFLQVGDSETLSAKVNPANASNQNVTWMSSSPGVATVNLNGKITAISTGSTDVTVTTQDGNFVAKSKVVVMAGTADAASGASPFIDIKEHWAFSMIMRAYERKVASGYPDFSFRPNANITRSEFTVMLMNGLKPAIEGSTLTFSDTDSIEDWAAKSVKQAVQKGIISGYPDGSFRPTANITHAEMISMVVKGLGFALTPGVATAYADDADIPEWAKPAAAISGKNNLLGGTEGNNFAPSALATRAEAVTAIVRMLDLLP
ncbi:PQQ-like domain-containing protein [Paenibacillus sp. 1_12]|uniref:S-layer homology domain-containing protein n=1 Tax=Paenibacillus sp. 1_12 TaxID=1566278 RepID=UPI0008EB6494|nr:S-layer homology domain-containing protein [Paenibacillus sp. 1_12]SFK83335.1 PQQ-like domain-containing protein [Paenibacillus sp. 1_12]